MAPRLTVALLAPALVSCASERAAGVEEVFVDAVRPVVTEADLTLALPADVAVDAEGTVYVLDRQDRRVVVLDRDGERVRTIGGPGEGPGELGPLPVDLGIVGQSLFVYDLGRRSIDEFRLDGSFVRQHHNSAGSLPGAAASFGPAGFAFATGVVQPGGGLATVLKRDTLQERQVGELVVETDEVDEEAFFDEAARGLTPQLMRNAASVVLGWDGGVWLFLQTEEILQRYAADGSLELSLPIEIDEAEAIRAAFFGWYAKPENQGGYRFLRLVTDGIEIDGRLWLLWATEETDGLVTIHDRDGAIAQRVRFAMLRGEDGAAVSPGRFAVDPEESRVYLVSSSASALWAIDLPESVSAR